MIIKINGIDFAETNDDMLESLFSGTNTCAGYIKRRNSSTIYIYDKKGDVCAFIAKVIGSAKKSGHGKVWHSYGWPSILGDEPTLSYQSIIIKELLNRSYKGC